MNDTEAKEAVSHMTTFIANEIDVRIEELKKKTEDECKIGKSITK